MSRLRRLIWAIKLSFRFLVYAFSFLLPRSDGLVVCTGDPSGRFGGNPKYLYLKAQENEDITAVWLARDKKTEAQLSEHDLPVRTAGSVRAAWTMLRSESIVISHDLIGWEFLGGATIVQTWHGNALKTIGKDAGDDPSRIRGWLQTQLLQDWDYITVTGGGAPKQTFASAFEYSEEQVVETGYPRNDPLYREIDHSGLDGIGKHESWKDYISENKCVLYMPTWRRGIYGSEGAAIEDHGLELESVGEFCEQRGFDFLLKLHPSEGGETNDYDAVHTLPEYLDVYDVLSDVDILVTDYSSIYFDYLHVNNPVVFYPYDLETYESMRGFYFDYDEVTPGPRASSQSELLSSLDEIMSGNDQYESQRKELLNEFYDHTDGDSSGRVIRILG